LEKAKITVEKRGSPRFSISVPVKYRREKDEKVLQQTGGPDEGGNSAYTLDLSLGGLQLALDPPLVAGEVLHIEIPLLNRKKVGVHARVIRAGRRKAGLQFLEMTDVERGALQSFFDFLHYQKDLPRARK